MSDKLYIVLHMTLFNILFVCYTAIVDLPRISYFIFKKFGDDMPIFADILIFNMKKMFRPKQK